MKNIQIILSDFVGLWRVCGGVVALKWLLCITSNFPEILRRKDLQPADRAMGDGPFQVKLRQSGVSFTIFGKAAISGIREMYVRDTYLHGGLLQLVDGYTVVDLGANMGNFTSLALAHGEAVRVVAVEPSAEMNDAFRRSVGLNEGYLERTMLIRAFVGSMAKLQESLIKQDANYKDALWFTEEQLIQEANLSRVDFLKCDIEGGEFGLLNKDSKLLAMTRFLAVEIHAFAGDVDLFIDELKSSGFTILEIKWDPDGSCTALAKRA